MAWFFPPEGVGSDVNSHTPQNIELVVAHDLDMDHPAELVRKPLPFEHIQTDLEEK